MQYPGKEQELGEDVDDDKWKVDDCWIRADEGCLINTNFTSTDHLSKRGAKCKRFTVPSQDP